MSRLYRHPAFSFSLSLSHSFYAVLQPINIFLYKTYSVESNKILVFGYEQTNILVDWTNFWLTQNVQFAQIQLRIFI